MRYKLLVLAILAASLLSCNRSQAKIDDVKDEIEYAEENKADLTASDLENLEIIMDELEGDISLSPDKYTEEQIKEFRKLQGKYAALLVKKGINNFQESLKDLGTQMEGFIEGFQSDTLNKKR